jgi:hypothetical protein
MPTAHPRPWHRHSQFGPGPRRPLDREQRARFRFLLTAHRRARLTPHAELIGNALVRRLGIDGQLDPAHETVARDVGCSSRTVRRALGALKAIGLVLLGSAGWCETAGGPRRPATPPCWCRPRCGLYRRPGLNPAADNLADKPQE